MKSKLVVIGGPTAMGKTGLAALVAKEFDGELISADSRQVYTGMDVGTGKDRPANVKIWGYDLVKPDEDFSMADWVNFAWSVIKKLWRENKLPIVVGGTGLYLKSLMQPPESLGIKPNKRLRQKLEAWTIQQLQAELKRVDKSRFRQMNWSDRYNPRRLIRAIEVSLVKASAFDFALGKQVMDVVWVGLAAERAVLEKRIRHRVMMRASRGMTEEVKRLIREYADWDLPAFSATGYSQWREYIEGKLSRDEAIEQWQRAEIQYMRRQLTWFKKMRQFTWFDIDQETWQNQVREFLCKKLKFPTGR